MKLKFLALCAPVAMLAACGGGDSSPPPTGGGGTPTPTPPPPPPQPSYTKFADLTGDLAFDTACGTIAIDTSVSPPLSVSASGEFTAGLDFEFDDAAQSWTVIQPGQFDGDPPITYTFSSSDEITNPPADVTGYAKPNANGQEDELFFRGPGTTGIDIEYVRIAEFNRAVTPNSPGFFAAAGSTCVYGVPSVAEEAYPTGEFTFTEVSVYGFAVRKTGPAGDDPVEIYVLSDSTGTFTADYINGAVTMTIDLKGRLVGTDGSLATTVTQFPKLTEGTGSFDLITESKGVDMTYRGQFTTDGIRGFDFFAGWFFGPDGVEAGYSFEVQPGPPLAGETDFSEYKIAGVVVAKR